MTISKLSPEKLDAVRAALLARSSNSGVDYLALARLTDTRFSTVSDPLGLQKIADNNPRRIAVMLSADAKTWGIGTSQQMPGLNAGLNIAGGVMPFVMGAWQLGSLVTSELWAFPRGAPTTLCICEIILLAKG